MTDINPLAGNQSAVPTSPTQTQAFGEEFNSFIQLLTAQVQNQDPLSPLDSTQFVEQLATFSSLEQQVRANASLESIATMMSDLHAIIASEWLGEKVSVESSWVPYTGEPVEFAFDAPTDADRAVLAIQDTNGDVIWTQTLDREAELHSWEGRTQSGEPASADALFQFRIDLYRNDDYLGSLAPRVITTVTDVASENGQLRLGTDSHLTADLGSVRKVD